MTVHLHKESEKIRIKRRVRQGDTISLKLLTATLESIFRRLNWENKGVQIDGEFLTNLRFADDILSCTERPQELQQMPFRKILNPQLCIHMTGMLDISRPSTDCNKYSILILSTYILLCNLKVLAYFRHRMNAYHI